ncbi:NAD-dependent epimerase/dehydratase family protein [Allosphingosinicella flava]|uniref:NAD-dependent epimerase/dehydratase family protein n=1 Tax=Allosphingosinicella flava TaxID=2771430 RepID=A0A7T2LMM0_9SPHN|nr:NAD-dependent epimerase/dehydratase family protein [Sphingosinicella flava]QPQ55418.1 NAD-dependent epimerase/dehydratase family protein [Sphingosinicella flava]
MMGHVLITGGAGFIGSHLADTLLDRGFEVTILDCLLPQVHGDAEVDADGWPTYLNPAVRRIRGDILDDGVFEAALGGVTHLCHLAASVGVGQSMTNIVDYTRNNALGAAVILETLSRVSHTVRRIAVASSMSIYGEGAYRGANGVLTSPPARTHEQLARREWELSLNGEMLAPVATGEDKPLHPTSIYAINKRDHEEMFLSVGRALGIPTVALRLFNVYGSRQALSNPYTGVAAIFISRLLNDQPPLIFEDGEQRRDFVHVHDVANAFAAALASDLALWDVFNVGSGRSISVNGIAFTLSRLLRKNIAPEILGKYRVGDIRHCFADIGKLEQAFGVRPQRSFDEGMDELIEWVRMAKPPEDRGEACLRELTGSRLVI